ncbi:MAG: hypothetical protein SRB2_04636 [Desulfobacteraceae bacterium Eth-SRB2]|nr:MAG: hypothetical protein SRB2_04636 [Desulfobacteraceae bacterium Eth-SRB2]
MSNEVTVSGITHYMRKVFDAVVDNEVVFLKKSKPNNNIVNIIIYQDKDKFDKFQTAIHPNTKPVYRDMRNAWQQEQVPASFCVRSAGSEKWYMFET